MSSLGRSLAAKWILAWALFKNILRVLVYGVRGPRDWLAAIRAESLGVTPAGTWTYLAATSRCIGCGICDVAGRPGERPSQWIVQIIRQPADSLLALDKARRLAELAPAIAHLCPQGMQAQYVSRLVEDHARMLRGE